MIQNSVPALAAASIRQDEYRKYAQILPFLPLYFPILSSYIKLIVLEQIAKSSRLKKAPDWILS
jgi:hypothetical protein